MEKQLKLFFEFLENEKKLSDNTLQAYKRDLKQFKRFLESYGIPYNRVHEEDMNLYIKELQDEGRKASSISRCIASIRSFYQFAQKRKKVKKRKNLRTLDFTRFLRFSPRGDDRI